MTLILQEEYPLLYDMLKRNALIRSTDPDDRESLLHACGFSTLADKLQLGKPADSFVANLITKLEKMKGRDRPPLKRLYDALHHWWNRPHSRSEATPRRRGFTGIRSATGPDFSIHWRTRNSTISAAV